MRAIVVLLSNSDIIRTFAAAAVAAAAAAAAATAVPNAARQDQDENDVTVETVTLVSAR
ncbi:hypothetical protein WUBG_03802 [Wuchereria bancrofti]|uniref:Uncharacterized protein n=1 Tax=Wuchereria bancrofti TaxID=6293 RepID=J9BDL8_WUCBA|nr:hypothetical protein WUBG_03802 [Wuchereria bancrofti]